MAHNSNAFGGDAQKWAKGLAAWGYRELLSSRSRAPFFTSCEGTACVIIPWVQPDRLRLTVLYGCKRALSAKRLSDCSAGELVVNWRQHCRAFIVCELDPSTLPFLKTIDHDGTRNAAKELMREYFTVAIPALGEFDLALGTSLEIFEAKPFERASEVIIDALSHH